LTPQNGGALPYNGWKWKQRRPSAGSPFNCLHARQITLPQFTPPAEIT
jgi:hypothetical protein